MVSPGRLPTGVLKSRVRARSDTYTVYRPTNTTNGWEQSDTFITDANGNYLSADLDMYTARSTQQQIPTGVKQSTRVAGLCLTNADIEVGDMVSFGGEPLELDGKNAIPATGTTAIYQLEWTDRDDVELP